MNKNTQDSIYPWAAISCRLGRTSQSACLIFPYLTAIGLSLGIGLDRPLFWPKTRILFTLKSYYLKLLHYNTWPEMNARRICDRNKLVEGWQQVKFQTSTKKYIFCLKRTFKRGKGEKKYISPIKHHILMLLNCWKNGTNNP